jgi:cyanophycinase
VRGLRTTLLAAALALAIPRPAAALQGAGHLFIVGGGEQSDSLVQRFVDLAGGPGRARIVVVPMASSEPRETGEEKAEQLRGLGAEVEVLVLSRKEALDSASIGPVAEATGIWFTGGDQVPLARVLLGTPVLRAIQGRYRRGAVVGGTSAGAAIMGDSMLTGNQRRPDSLGYYGDSFPVIAAGVYEVVPGLGFLPGVLVDQHFVVRERQNRLLSALLERPGLLGVGIDEGTALEVGPSGRWCVAGRSVVLIYDLRRARVQASPSGILGGQDLRLQVLVPGECYAARGGRVTVPSSPAR